MKFVLFLLLTILGVYRARPFPLKSRETAQQDVLQGYYHTWWTITPVPTDIVKKMLPDNSFDLVTKVPISDFPTGHHPVAMEIGYESDCGPIGVEPLQMDFEEFKYCIPYVVARGSNPGADVYPLNYKSVIYMPSTILALSSRLSYNLNASRADYIHMSDTGYNIQKQQSSFTAVFQPDGEWETDNARLSIMKNTFNQTWFGKFKKDPKSCGNNHYSFDKVRFRPASGTMRADKGIFSPFFPSEEIQVPSVNQVSYGAVEVYVNFTISPAHNCLP